MVFFDDLGDNWPQHNCQDELPPPEYNPTDADFFRAMQGITQTIQPKNDGLLPGMIRASGSINIDPSSIQRIQHTKNRIRNTMPMEPMGKANPIGRVTHVLRKVSLKKRHGVKPNTIGAETISKILGGLTVTQITILVDEIDIDPAAEDLLSYTFWCKPPLVPKSLSTNDVVEVAIKPIEIWSIGRRWVATSLDVLT